MVASRGDGRPHPGSPEGSPAYDVDDWSSVIAEIRRARHPRSDELDVIDAHRTDSALPWLDLPGFGEPLPDCGDYVDEAKSFCVECGDLKHNRRNCLRYDCPDHAPYAVRRRAAGSMSGSGVAPRLDALRRYLNAYRADNQYFHHLTIEVPVDYFLESGYPLDRAKEICREIMDVLGIQGLLAYHPWKGDNEELDEDDRGEWKKRLFHGRDWEGDVREELKPKAHFHVVGVAPYIDLSEVGDLYDATGWVIHRITRSDDSAISIEDDDGMTRRTAYVLSHSGIYETRTGQRRLAAWMKGPDVNRISVLRDNKRRITRMTHHTAEETLGIPAPSYECERHVDEDLSPNRYVDDGIQSFQRATEMRSELAPGESEPLGGFGGPQISTGDISSSGGAIAIAPGSSASTYGGASASPSSSMSTPRSVAPADVDEDEPETCGGRCRHISQAGEYLLDESWRSRAPFADELDEAYREYVDVMTSKGLDPLEGEPTIPEEDLERDRPPDD